MITSKIFEMDKEEQSPKIIFIDGMNITSEKLVDFAAHSEVVPFSFGEVRRMQILDHLHWNEGGSNRQLAYAPLLDRWVIFHRRPNRKQADEWLCWSDGPTAYDADAPGQGGDFSRPRYSIESP